MGNYLMISRKKKQVAQRVGEKCGQKKQGADKGKLGNMLAEIECVGGDTGFTHRIMYVCPELVMWGQGEWASLGAPRFEAGGKRDPNLKHSRRCWHATLWLGNLMGQTR